MHLCHMSVTFIFRLLQVAYGFISIIQNMPFSMTGGWDVGNRSTYAVVLSYMALPLRSCNQSNFFRDCTLLYKTDVFCIAKLLNVIDACSEVPVYMDLEKCFFGNISSPENTASQQTSHTRILRLQRIAELAHRLLQLHFLSGKS